MFRGYMHIERFGNDEVQGIELGSCHVFPKLDGTNASVWWDGGLKAGSRTRELELEQDNAGFYAWVLSGPNTLSLTQYFERYPKRHLYGEWLVPHSLRTYRDDAWRRFWIFDVWDFDSQMYLPYEQYIDDLLGLDLDVVLPTCVINNATYDSLLVELENNKFLIQEGRGSGEGIVVKNYGFANRFGRTVWAKLVTNVFKEKHVATMGPTVKNMREMTEHVIAQEYVSKHLVDKTYAKIVNEESGWNSRFIPRLFDTIYHDLVVEEMWDIVKKYKRPVVDFKTLYSLTIMRIKELRPELF